MDVRSYSLKDINSFKTHFQAELSSGFKPTLAICFTDATIDFESIDGFLNEQNIDTVGSTTCGEIYNEGWAEESCSILMLDLDKSNYHIELASFDQSEDVIAKQIAEVAIEKFKKPAIITYIAKLGANGDRTVSGFKEVLTPETPIFGGLAGDDFKNEKFTVFSNGKFETDGMVALIIDGEKIEVAGTAFSGWKPLGKTHVVSKVEGNVLYEVDNKPALDLFIEYFGLEQSNATGDEKMEAIPGIYPIKVIDESQGDYMRSPLLYNRKEQSLILGGEVQVGDRVKFCPMPDLDTISETVNYFEEYAKANSKVDAIIMNSCAGRKFAFGPLMHKETKEFYDIWKVPTVGLMAMGEIGSLASDKECKFHNVTCSFVSLTEISSA